MTALANQLRDLGLYQTAGIADAAITRGDVYKDDNGQVRVAGHAVAIVANAHSGSYTQVATLVNRRHYPLDSGAGGVWG